jgi:hypothetical protein
MVVLVGMPSTAISVKIPTRILEQMPAPGNGRSVFIVKAIEEKLARRRCDWNPRSERGRRMAALLAKGRTERRPLLSDEQLEQELKERRGRRF